MRAVFTIVKNETIWMCYWIQHYLKHFNPQDIYVLDNSSDGESKELLSKLQKDLQFNVYEIHHEYAFDHKWLRDQVCLFQKHLLEKYKYVLFAECDEIIDADVGLGKFIEHCKEPVCRCSVYHCVQTMNEDPIDWKQPLMKQRSLVIHEGSAKRLRCKSKALLASVPIRWGCGFHESDPEGILMDGFYMAHLHYIDYGYAKHRHELNAKMRWKDDEHVGLQNRATGDKFDVIYYSSFKHIMPMPEFLKEVI